MTASFIRISGLKTATNIKNTDYMMIEQSGGTRKVMLKDLNIGSGSGSGTGADGKSAYEIWLDLGNTGTEQDFINSLQGKGLSITKVYTSISEMNADYGNTSVVIGDTVIISNGDSDPDTGKLYVKGETKYEYLCTIEGGVGATGADGKSAYQIWLDLGNTGTEQDFINALKGDEGKSAYEVWKAIPGNESKTESDFISSIKGEKGDEGKSAYEIWESLSSNNGKSIEEFIAAITGPKGDQGETGPQGPQGEQGIEGKSAFQSWLDQDGNSGKTEEMFLSAIKGEKGDAGPQGVQGPQGPRGIEGKSAYETYVGTLGETETPLSQEQWLASLKGKDGTNGTDGKSAYDIYKDTVPEEQTPLSEEEWLASLKGETGAAGADGINGTDGKSAYELYVASYVATEEQPDPLSQEEWLASLKGKDGTNGTDGKDFVIQKYYDSIDAMNADFDTCGLDINSYVMIRSDDISNVDAGKLYYKGETEFVFVTKLSGVKGDPGVDGKSAYDIYKESVTEGEPLSQEEWLASLKGETGADGATGKDGKSAYELYVDSYVATAEQPDPLSQEEWLASLKGETGADGAAGKDGKSVYQSYVDTFIPTAEQSEPLSEADWVASLGGTIGKDGKSAYQSYLDTTSDDPKLSEEEWLASLKGETGADGAAGVDGKSAYELYVASVTEGEPLSEANWLASLKGETGTDGAAGVDGKSAYDIYKESVTEGEPLSQEEWLASLKGEDGDSFKIYKTYESVDAMNSDYFLNPNLENGIFVMIKPTDTTDASYGNLYTKTSTGMEFVVKMAGVAGKSAYELYVDSYVATEEQPDPLSQEEWLASLKGEDGIIGVDGKSAYQSYLDTTSDDPKLSEEEWAAARRYNDVVDNLETTDSEAPLSANQGVEIDKRLTVLEIKMLGLENEAPVVTVTGTPSFGTVAVGTTITNPIININVDKGTYGINNIKIYKDDVLIDTLTGDTLTAEIIDYDYGYEGSITTDTIFKIVVTDDAGFEAISEEYYRFAGEDAVDEHTYFYGAIDESTELTLDNISSATTKGYSLSTPTKLDITVDIIDNCFVFVYPKAWGEVRYMLDEAGFNFKDTCTLSTISTTVSTGTIEFYCYKAEAAYAEDFNIKIQF